MFTFSATVTAEKCLILLGPGQFEAQSAVTGMCELNLF
jgi:hypothetical protein